MPASYPSERVERARILFTTTTLTVREIAAEVGVNDQTIRRWVKAHGWTRPPGAEPDARRKIPKNLYPPLQRLYENRGTTADIALVAGISFARLNRIAADEGWTPRRVSAAGLGRTDKPMSGALAEIQGALRDPTLSRADKIRLIEQASALVAADALGGDAGAERAMQILTRAATLIRSLPEPSAAPPHKDAHARDDADPFPDANDLIEEIARHFETIGDGWLDPRILAAVAASVP